MSSIPKIVLSGGPCGGKTQGLCFLNEQLTALGFNVFMIKESAETLIKSGFDRKEGFEFQKAIALNQLKLEKDAEEKAEKAKHPVIICDRGLMDARVYLSDADFAKFKEEVGLNDTELRDRYDAVFHMDSMSKNGIIEDNGVRNETPEEAKSLNEISLEAWCGNPYYRVIPVCESFNDKLQILLKEVKTFLKNYSDEKLKKI